MARFIQCHRSLQIHVSVYWSQICFSLKLTDVQLLILEGFHRHFSPERSEKPITGWYGILHAGISSALLPDRFKQCQKKGRGDCVLSPGSSPQHFCLPFSFSDSSISTSVYLLSWVNAPHLFFSSPAWFSTAKFSSLLRVPLCWTWHYRLVPKEWLWKSK